MTAEMIDEMIDEINWQDISRRLRAPFDPEQVDFRVQGKPSQSGKTQVVAYIDARSVQDRLDEAVGAGAWSFDWTPLVVDNGDVQVAKGTLTIHGVAKSDAGTASHVEQSLGAVSHCFKRAAVMWGIGRYLYDLGRNWVTLDNGRISDATMRQLRASLPRPDGTAPQPAPAQRDAGRPAAATADDGETLAPPTDAQSRAIARLCGQLQRPTPVFRSFTEASRLISELQADVRAAASGRDLAEAFPAGQRGA